MSYRKLAAFSVCAFVITAGLVWTTRRTNAQAPPPSLVVAAGFSVETVAAAISSRPAGLAFTPQGDLLVGDSGGGFDCSTADGRILKLDPSGAITSFVNPAGVLQDIGGMAYG